VLSYVFEDPFVVTINPSLCKIVESVLAARRVPKTHAASADHLGIEKACERHRFSPAQKSSNVGVGSPRARRRIRSAWKRLSS